MDRSSRLQRSWSGLDPARLLVVFRVAWCVAAGNAAGGRSVAVMPLHDRDRAILAFEARWQRHGGAKEEAIRAELGVTPARYYQLLGRLVDSPAALAHDPLLVNRLRRIRDERIARRVA